MSIRIDCPHCGTRQNVADVLAGFQTACEHCRSPIHVPGNDAPQSAAPTWHAGSTHSNDTPPPAYGPNESHGFDPPFASSAADRLAGSVPSYHDSPPTRSRPRRKENGLLIVFFVLIGLYVVAMVLVGVGMALSDLDTSRRAVAPRRTTVTVPNYQVNPPGNPDDLFRVQQPNHDALRRVEEINRINRENAQRRHQSFNRHRQQPRRYTPTRPGVPTAPRPYSPYTP